MTPFLIGLAVYTTVAFAVEAVFTGVADQLRRMSQFRPIDPTFPCRTSLWVILVYGLSAAVSFPMLSAAAPSFFSSWWPLRGICYALGIFAWEWFWGMTIERVAGRCPWRYRDSGHATLRYIKPEYAPLWFGFGFLLEALHLRIIPLLSGG